MTTDSKVTDLDDGDATAAANNAAASKPASGTRAAAKAEAAAAPAEKPAKKAKDPNRLVTLTIHPGLGDNGNDAVFVSVNEYARLIPRNLPCDVPAYVVNVLREAKETKYATEGKVTTESEVPRFAFTVEEIE